jgi:2-C-methyl-D-erythritol 4-phosphate cytidylyltransferase
MSYLQKFAVIAAGGLGSRMGGDHPKQFLELHGKSILWHTINRFLAAYDDLKIILVLPVQGMETGLLVVQEFNQPHRFDLALGGETRFHSVKNGLHHVPPGALVAVHDAARCLVSTELIRHCFEMAAQKGSAIPAIKSKDSLRLVQEDGSNQMLNREQVRLIQTPQTFQSDILLSAFRQNWTPAFTDEASVVEAMGKTVYLVEGEETNIKITVPSDLLLASQILAT